MVQREKLNVVDVEGNILSEEYRDVIHKKGLLHREVHVWLYTPDCKLIFQHRAKDKDTFPDLLDATAGGHVEIGDNWIESAIKELEEETGITTTADSLDYIDQIHHKAHDEETGMVNNALRRIYALKYEGSVNDLVVEEGKALGFEAWSLERIVNGKLTEEEKYRFISVIFDDLNMGVIRKIYDRC